MRLYEIADTDEAYATRYFARTRDPKGREQVIRDEIVRRTTPNHPGYGSIGALIGPEGFADDEAKEHLSAIRWIAKQMGFEVGQFRFHPTQHTATAPIAPSSTRHRPAGAATSHWPAGMRPTMQKAANQAQ